MLKHVGLKNYKGIKDKIELRNLGRINVLCGKNNSGKTSILEAIATRQNMGFAVTEESLSRLEQLFLAEAQRYTGPRPDDSIAWFRKHIKKLIEDNAIWYIDEKEKIVDLFRESLKKDPVIGRHDPNIFNHSSIVEQYLNELLNSYKPILIPPKRRLESINLIKLDQSTEPDGTGLLNRLFYLKNQDLESRDFKIYKKIYDAFYDITENYFNIIPDPSNNITLYFRGKSRDWIRADGCGLGLSDILIVLALMIDFDYSLILLEEPESHLHPDMQRRLLFYIQENVNKQFFLTTHSNIFLDNAFIDKVYFTSFNKSVVVNDYTSRASILDDLGYSITDNLVSDLVILVEGPKDIPIIEEYLIKMNLYNRFDIKLWPLGGDIMDQLDLSVFAQNYSIIGLVDNDPLSKGIRDRFIEHCEKLKIEVVKLTRYAIENYFTLRVLKELFGNQISGTISQIVPDKKLEDQIAINVKNNNRKLAKAMTIAEIEGTDLYSFLFKVKKLCEGNAKGPATMTN